MNTPRYINNIGIILDALIFLGIVICAVYTTKKRKKYNGWKGQNYIEDKDGINEEKGVVIKKIQQDIKKYNDGKQLIRAMFSIPTLIMIPIILSIGIWFSLSEHTTNKSDYDILLSLVICFVMLIFCVFLFINLKKTINKHTEGGFSRIMRIFFLMFTIAAIIISGWFVGCYIFNKLGSEFEEEFGVVGSFIIITSIILLLSPFFPSKIRSININESLVHNVIKVAVAFIGSNTIVILGFGGIPFLCKILGLGTRLSAIIRLLFGLLSIILGFYFLFRTLFSKSNTTLINNKVKINGLTDNKPTNNIQKYNNRKGKKKT